MTLEVQTNMQGVNKIGEKAGESKCALVFGQMNEPPGARARVALTGLTIAEYFRDIEGQDVLFFVDNIFRFTQVCGLSTYLVYNNSQEHCGAACMLCQRLHLGRWLHEMEEQLDSRDVLLMH